MIYWLKIILLKYRSGESVKVEFFIRNQKYYSVLPTLVFPYTNFYNFNNMHIEKLIYRIGKLEYEDIRYIKLEKTS